MGDERWFSPDYATARGRFRAAVAARGAVLEVVSIGLPGPDGGDLTLDVARVGSPKAKRVVVVSSALHGVEGFLGSAVQLATLEDLLGRRKLDPDLAVVFVHALNPFGFAWIRRVDQDNIDLNRNFLREGEDFRGSPPGYAALDKLLNPQTPPGRLNLFLPRAVFQIARHGMATLKNAVAGGQYDFPKGLFFGGSRPSTTQALLAAHLPRWIGEARRVLHLDFHTGLGKRGTVKLLVDHPWGGPGIAALGEAFGRDRVEAWEPEKGVSYQIRGGLGTWCKERFPEVDYDVLCAEFGTTTALRVIEALHQENRAHHYGDRDSARYQAAKSRLRETFAPQDPKWESTTVRVGLGLVETALDRIRA
jgi:hypothetical protein